MKPSGNTLLGPALCTVLALLAGCDEAIAPEPTAASLEVSPETVQLEVGQTTRVTATVRDAAGRVLAGASVSWTSSDAAVATVDAEGLVTAVSPGEATITATSGQASGQTAVTVRAESFVPGGDTEIGGSVEVHDFTISEGLTVRVTDDLVLTASGAVEIGGALVGDCVSLALSGRSTVSITGEVGNACSAPPDGEPPGLTVAGDGDLTLDGAALTSSGDIEIRNSPVGGTSASPERATAAAASSTSSSSAQDPSTMVIRSTDVTQSPAKAPGGSSAEGEDISGSDGRDIGFISSGPMELAASQIVAQSGGDGADMEVQVAGFAEAVAGSGGDGGDVSFTAEVLRVSSNTLIRSGDGGRAGNARAVALPGPEGSRAPDANADVVAGGGWAGEITFSQAGTAANLSIEVEEGTLTISVGSGGYGGDATAEAADGMDASDSDPAQHGGHATGTSGEGGGLFDVAGIGSVTGSVVIEAGTAGAGGDLSARAGDGGDGNEKFPDGGDGGGSDVTAFEGGHHRVRDLTGNLFGKGGNGGTVTLMGGNGGAGWDACQAGAPGPGGAGGNGPQFPDEVVAFDGGGGEGAQKGAPGGVVLMGVGNGGAGGDGDPPGSGGNPGEEDILSQGPRDDQGDNFTPGAPGNACPAASPSAAGYVFQDQTTGVTGVEVKDLETMEVVSRFEAGPGEEFIAAFDNAEGGLGLVWRKSDTDWGIDFSDLDGSNRRPITQTSSAAGISTTPNACAPIDGEPVCTWSLEGFVEVLIGGEIMRLEAGIQPTLTRGHNRLWFLAEATDFRWARMDLDGSNLTPVEGFLPLEPLLDVTLCPGGSFAVATGVSPTGGTDILVYGYNPVTNTVSDRRQLTSDGMSYGPACADDPAIPHARKVFYMLDGMPGSDVWVVSLTTDAVGEPSLWSSTLHLGSDAVAVAGFTISSVSM